MHIQLSLSLHFYLLYLLLNCCNRNDVTLALEAAPHCHMGKHITQCAVLNEAVCRPRKRLCACVTAERISSLNIC